MMYKNNFVAVVKSSGSILRETGNTVYLEYGSEYSILLKNKDSRKALVSIEVDGEDVLNGHGLIVSANTTQEVKGFMRDMSETNRFKFINKTKQIQSHRGDRLDDGLIRITYRFQEPTRFGNNLSIQKRLPDWWDNSKIWAEPMKYNNSTDVYYGSTINSSSNITANFCLMSAPQSDEGITVKGEKIKENYEYGHIGTLDSVENVIIIQLKGITSAGRRVNKTVTVKTKIKCSTCGSTNRSNNNFCWKCGTYIK